MATAVPFRAASRFSPSMAALNCFTSDLGSSLMRTPTSSYFFCLCSSTSSCTLSDRSAKRGVEGAEPRPTDEPRRDELFDMRCAVGETLDPDRDGEIAPARPGLDEPRREPEPARNMLLRLPLLPDPSSLVLSADLVNDSPDRSPSVVTAVALLSDGDAGRSEPADDGTTGSGIPSPCPSPPSLGDGGIGGGTSVRGDSSSSCPSAFSSGTTETVGGTPTLVVELLARSSAAKLDVDWFDEESVSSLA
mmetsp:Transcript_5841/g.19048  ORF Transcript_5841/g.19048 Transcript_5841/m.19048 type:complete len:248 (-) Transcript_5841:735-1478(-)